MNPNGKRRDFVKQKTSPLKELDLSKYSLAKESPTLSFTNAAAAA